MSKKKYFILLNFSGAGSKLLQSLLGNFKEVFTLPAYPLIYFPFHFEKWSKNKKLKPLDIFNLIYKHHTSIFDTRKLKGFNGLNNLGKFQKGYLKISKDKFKKNFIKSLEKKNINQKNLIDAIHESYQYSINNKKKYILYHVHAIDTYSTYLKNDFKNEKILATTRHPTYNFWRRAYADDKIDQARYDYTDYENLKNYRYITRLRDLYLQFLYCDLQTNKKFKLIRFEDLKTKNKETLKKISKFLKIKFSNSTNYIPSFNNKEWFGSKIYKGHSSKKSFVSDSFNIDQDLNLFSKYDIFILEFVLLPFLNKLKYKPTTKVKNNFGSYIVFLFFLLLPTKFGLKLFFSRLRIKTIKNYVINAFLEIFNAKQKNYYFNAMYKYKWSYKLSIFIKGNFVRKLSYTYKNNKMINCLSFFIKFLLYPVFQLELIALYFVKIYYILALFFLVKNKIKYISKL